MTRHHFVHLNCAATKWRVELSGVKHLILILGLTFTLDFLIGAGAVSIVIITIAGALSPPVILAIAKHRKLTSNQWWTYTRRERYFAIGWGVVMGTLMLPLLAPWGIYKLFKILGTKLLHNTIYWLRLLDSRCRGVQGEETDERYRDWPVESVDTRQERALFVLDREKTTINGCQSSADPEKMQMVPRQPIPTETFGYNKGFLDEDNCCAEENLADVNGVGVILGSTEEDDDELGDFEDSCRKCTGTVWKPGHGRHALSDEENDDGRRDTQRLWARKAVSDTIFHVKKPAEDFKARERVNGLCPAHRHETNQAFNGEENPLLQVLAEWRMSKESRDEDEAGSSVLANGLQNTDKGEGMCNALQCQEIKDLPEKGPKKTKKRRKRRTDKQLVKKNLDRSAIAVNEPLRKEAMEKGTLTPQLSVIRSTAEAEQEETALQAEKKIPRKYRKGKQPAREMTEEMLNQREKRKTKTKKAKHHEELRTHTVRGQIACRFNTSSPKKYQPEKTDCSKPQKSRETRNKNPFTVSSNGEGVQVETKRRGSKLERMNAFSMKMDDLKPLKPSATAVSSTSSQQDQQDIVALFDEID